MNGMPVVLVTGAGGSENIAGAIVPRLRRDGWNVTTSDLAEGDYPCAS